MKAENLPSKRAFAPNVNESSCVILIDAPNTHILT